MWDGEVEQGEEEGAEEGGGEDEGFDLSEGELGVKKGAEVKNLSGGEVVEGVVGVEGGGGHGLAPVMLGWWYICTNVGRLAGWYPPSLPDCRVNGGGVRKRRRKTAKKSIEQCVHCFGGEI